MSDINYTLSSPLGEVSAPKPFIDACITFTSMFEDIGNNSADEPIPITDMYSVQQVKDYIQLFMDIYNLKINIDSGEIVSYPDYIINHYDEFLQNYTNKNVDPPHCQELIEIFIKYGSEKITELLELDGFFNNMKLRRGVMLIIVAYIRLGEEDKIDNALGKIMEVLQSENNVVY
jgi:hypothetical protein